MKQKGFAPLLIILLIAILGVVGYLGYKSYKPTIQLNTKPTNSPSVLISPSPTANLATGWEKYENKENKFSLEVPAGMQIIQENAFNASPIGETMIWSGDYMSSKPGVLIKGWELIIHTWDKPMNFDNGVLLSTDKKTINGILMTIYSKKAEIDNSDSVNTSYEVAFVKDKIYYRLYFTIEKSKLSEAKTIFYQILSTFKFYN